MADYTQALRKLLLLLGIPVLALRAQNADSLSSARADEVLARVRRFTSSDVSAARVLADSLVTSLPAGSAALPAALFAKASIAPSAAEAERDYSRIINEFRFAPQVPDALMRLALLESARNNRAGALKSLDRLLRDHSDAAVRSRASLLAGRLRMEAGDPARACELLAAAYASAGTAERDVRDQAESIGASCPTAVAVMAKREPPPMGIMRAPGEGTVAATGAATPANGRRTKSATAAQPKAGAPVVRRDTVPSAKPRPAVVKRDTAPTPKPAPVVVKRDTAPTPKRAPLVVKRDTAPTPKPAPVVVKRDTVPSAKPQPAVVKRDTAPTPKPAPLVVRRDSAPTPVPVLVKRDTAPTPRPAPVVAKRDTAPTPRPVVTAPPVVAPAAAVSGTRYGVQFAAYNDKPGAERLASTLRTRGITARVEGDAKPFRVRAGRFATRAEAEASAVLWRRTGQPAIVVTLGPTP